MKSRYLFIGVGIVLILVVGVVLLKKKLPQTPAAGGAVSKLDKIKGPAEAPIEIIEYSDFQCPACQKAQPELDKLFAAHPEKIRLIFHHFPLPMHRWAAIAHQSAECAHEQGKFWEYHDRLYQHQKDWYAEANPVETYLRYAGEIGLNLDAFVTCLSSEKIKRRILEEKAIGEQLKVNSTPTFFINGERVVGPIELQAKGPIIIGWFLGLPDDSQSVTPEPATQSSTPEWKP